MRRIFFFPLQKKWKKNTARTGRPSANPPFAGAPAIARRCATQAAVIGKTFFLDPHGAGRGKHHGADRKMQEAEQSVLGLTRTFAYWGGTCLP